MIAQDLDINITYLRQTSHSQNRDQPSALLLRIAGYRAPQAPHLAHYIQYKLKADKSQDINYYFVAYAKLRQKSKNISFLVKIMKIRESALSKVIF